MRRLLQKTLLGLALSAAALCGAYAQVIDLSASKVVDLSHPYDANTIYWPTEPTGFELKQEHKGVTKGGFFYYSNAFCSPEHGGTHIDAPMHFAENRWTNSEIPLDRLIRPAVIIDISRSAAKNPDYALTPADIAAWEEANGRIPDGAIVLLRTGWSARWPDRKAYLGDDTPGAVDHLHFPSFGVEAATTLIAERHVSLIGVDTASVDVGASKEFLVHRVIGAANVPGLENLTNLDQLPATGTIVMAMPMKIAQGSGAPARVIAFAPR
ncbi:cyclase family protein [Methylocystis sp. MJC1]|uniref:cyclase family protein n=1 Tax=Methylocystis sp. MJC1 TaxID=2654282 RepID=UPI0013ED8BA5|nr:cyclase family protein [Methylocystis sp. MJC1]KAF2992462.1 Kynurenine formamidase [Methylocystis sp. MJC1]MBU6526440.1 cyclase family protein [Methylocystis sp. MJC1]UZX12882.1 cyclase family protein [Methylocystis sp. MJC1]